MTDVKISQLIFDTLPEEFYIQAILKKVSMTKKNITATRTTKTGKNKPANSKSFTIPFDVVVLILAGILIFIMFLLGYRSCRKNDEQLEKIEVKFEMAEHDSFKEGALL